MDRITRSLITYVVACVMVPLNLLICGCNESRDVFFNEVSKGMEDNSISTVDYGYIKDRLMFVVFQTKTQSTNYGHDYLHIAWKTLPSGKSICSVCELKLNDGTTINLPNSREMYQYRNGVLSDSKEIMSISKSDLESYLKWEKGVYCLTNFIEFVSANDRGVQK